MAAADLSEQGPFHRCYLHIRHAILEVTETLESVDLDIHYRMDRDDYREVLSRSAFKHCIADDVNDSCK